MNPDRSAGPVHLLATATLSAGWLEVALPLWYRRWWLLLGVATCSLAGLGLGLMQTVRFTGQASFVVQPLLRTSQSVVASALPALAGLVGPGGSPVDLYVSIMRSQLINDHIIDRFELQRLWDFRLRVQAQNRLAKRVTFGVGRRDGVVLVTVEDESAPRAAEMANTYVEELRATLRGFALEEARKRRQFYDTQLKQARSALQAAQSRLQTSGFDRAALRTEPRATAERYGRMQAEAAAAEVRLAATRRVRAEASPEVQQQLTELAALRAQLASVESPKEEGPGSFVNSVREFHYAEALAESIARQAEAARVDEAADAVPLQVLDRARAPEWPSSPRPLLWLLGGAVLGMALPAFWILLRHRMALARLDSAHQARVALIELAAGRRTA
jgi:uncharacterized protein involved in exopolysaccharide biosynthesis